MALLGRSLQDAGYACRLRGDRTLGAELMSLGTVIVSNALWNSPL
jgi:hypothetical protein